MNEELLRYRTSLLRSLRKDHPYHSVAAAALEENLFVTASRPLSIEENIVSIVNTTISQGGTGLLLNNEGFVLTCLHLVGHLQRERHLIRSYVIRDSQKQDFPLDPTFCAWDEEHDLALVRVLRPSSFVRTIPIAQRDPQQGEQVSYHPYPHGRYSFSLDGVIQDASADIQVQKNDESVMRRDSFVCKGRGEIGFSGAPIMSQRGEFLGNLFAGQNPGEDSSIFCTKGKYIHALIQEVISHLRE